jgi:hypothetical protein
MNKTFQSASLPLFFIFALAAAIGPGPGSDQGDDSMGRFPKLQASNLEKRLLNLPGDFDGSRNLLLVAFQREQQEQVDTWLREMKRFEEVDPGFRYYELPTIQSPNRLLRWIIDTGMRRGIPDPKARARTITLYIDKVPFLKALGITDERRIHCFLVDRTGRVLWRTEGMFEESKGLSLCDTLKKLMQSGSGGIGAIAHRSGNHPGDRY